MLDDDTPLADCLDAVCEVDDEGEVLAAVFEELLMTSSLIPGLGGLLE